MPKKRQSAARKPKGRDVGTDPHKQGMKAFSSNSFDAAISFWSKLDENDVQVKAALAEAYFRRALSHSVAANQVTDLQAAIKRAPDDPRYRYHLGLAQHRAGNITEAITCYETVLKDNPKWPGVGMVLALAHLTRDPQTDLASLPGSTPVVREALHPVKMLLCGDTPPPPQDETLHPMQTLWHGLGRIQAGDGSALKPLSDNRSLPSPRAQAVRRLYQGMAAAQAGDIEAAIKIWQHAYEDRIITSPILHHNLVAALVQHFQASIDTGMLEELAPLAQWVVRTSLQSSALDPLLVQVLDSTAHASADRGEWQQAVLLWENARQVVSGSSSLGSPRLLLHNLAIAYEMLEEWLAAAEIWRAMMRTRPRKTSRSDEDVAADPLAYRDEDWAWIRKRIITCYQHAGEPGEAVKVFRTAIKSDPKDLDMRIQLSDALLANQQEQASFNELYRILEIDPDHTEAHLRLAEMYSASNQWGAAEQSLRKVLDQQPEREDVRRQIARLILVRGNHLHNYGMLDAAEKIFEQGRDFAPTDYQFPLNLARIAIDRDRLRQAESLLEQVLQLGADDPRAFVYTIDCWTVVGRIDQARAVLERAERELTLDADFYIDLVRLLFSHDKPASPLTGLFGAPAQPQAQEMDESLKKLADEVLERAVAQKPDDPTVRLQLATELMGINPELALEQAEEAVRLKPDDPAMLLLLGLLQGLNERSRDAKATLRKAAKIARQQGSYDLADQAEQMRQEVDSPFFRLSLQMGMMGAGFDDGFDEGFDEDMDFFF